MRRILLAGAIIFAATPALADPNIKINQCVMGYVTPGDDTVVGHGVDFTNDTHHVVTAIRVNFVFLTPFNEILGTQTETDTGQFTPGIEIDHTQKDVAQKTILSGGDLGGFLRAHRSTKTYYWQVANPSQEPITKMKVSCELDAVSFSDGTVWSAPQASPTPGSS
jgi:hypothetical protein